MITLTFCLGAALASAHDLPHPLPAEPLFEIRWFQRGDAHDIQDWDIEVTPRNAPNDRFVVQAVPFPDESSCWVATVPTNGPAWVRVRAVQEGTVSDWSAYTSVPEPASGLALAVGGSLLALLRRRRPGRASGGPS